MKILVFKSIETEGKIFGVRLSDLLKILLSVLLLFVVFMIGQVFFGLTKKFLIVVFLVPSILFVYFRFFAKGKDRFFLETAVSKRLSKKIIKAGSFKI